MGLHMRCTFLKCCCLVVLIGWGGAVQAEGRAPSGEVKQLEAARKKTRLIAKYIKLSLKLGHLHRKYKGYNKALAVYRALGAKYNKPDVACVTQHFMAQTLLDQGKKQRAYGIYRKMTKAFRGCQCRYLPNAYIALGRGAFDTQSYKKALALYGKAPRCKSNRVGAIAAAYMKGWCAYKLGQYRKSLRALQRSLRALHRMRRRLRGEQLSMLQKIQKEGLPNLVRAYNRAGSPTGAPRAFKSVATPQQATRMLKQLSDSYHTTKSYKKLLALYQTLVRVHRRSPRLVRDELEVMRAAYRLKRTRLMMRSLQSLKRAIARFQGKAASDKVLATDLADAQDQIQRLGMVFRREGTAANNKTLFRQSETFLRTYREAFPKAKDAHAKAYWHGEVLFVLERFKKASDAYLVAARFNRAFKHKEDAAYKAALCRHRLLNRQQALPYRSPTASSQAKPKKLPVRFQAFLEAARVYTGSYPKGKQVPYVTYNVGLVYQMHQHWAKARQAFLVIVQKHPRSRYARASALHVVDTLRIRKQWGLLHKWASSFAAMNGFGTPLFKKQMKRMSQAAQTQSCYGWSQAKQHAKAGACFVTAAKALGSHREAPLLLYNAVVAYRNGGKADLAAKTKRYLLKTFPDSRPAQLLKRK